VSFWLEWHRELRRQAGDERLPLPLRTALKERARRALARAAVAARPHRRYPRRLIHTTNPVVRRNGTAAGAAGAQPTALVEIRRRIDSFADAARWLSARGYDVVRVGAGAERMRDVRDLSRPGPSPVPTREELLHLNSATLLICESVEFQQAGCAANVPTLLLNATDPFLVYPIRADGLFTLQMPVDLDTGEVLTPQSMLDERYFRNLRNYGYRANTGAEVLEAVRELHDGITSGEWLDTDSQQRYRDDAVRAAAGLASHIDSVAEWGADDGFLGDGRLARCQAERRP
jgi:hypothetical protein